MLFRQPNPSRTVCQGRENLDHLLTVVSLDYTLRTLSATVRADQEIVQPAADASYSKATVCVSSSCRLRCVLRASTVLWDKSTVRRLAFFAAENTRRWRRVKKNPRLRGLGRQPGRCPE